MKTYVFLTFAIFGIGGTQIYVRNKLLFLRAHGWNPVIVSSEPGDDLVIKELKPYDDLVFSQLAQNPYVFSKAARDSLLDQLADRLFTAGDEIVIESNYIQATIWGELLAKKLSAKHFIFLIQELYDIRSVKYLKYFDYKYKRGELAGNTKYALKMLFGSYRSVEQNNGELTAVCYNTIEDCATSLTVQSADYNIGSIGRVNKPFVGPMVDDLVDFAGSHPEDTFSLVFFGGSPDEQDYAMIRQKAGRAKNLFVQITGPIFPVPKKLLDQMDVFISCAGAARTSSDAGYITITMDSIDFKPIGILGYTTNDNVHRDPAKPYLTTSVLLEEILYEKKYAGQKPQVALSSADYMEVFEEHMAYLNRSAQSKEYYNVAKLRPQGKLLSRLIGQNAAETIKKAIRKLR